MNPDEPTHFNCLIAGTGLIESILAAALSKAGYSVLQLDPAPYYGTEHASLSLSELAQWAATTPGAEASAPAPPEQLMKQSQRFALSLCPMLLRAKGEAIDLLVRSKVAAYLQFGLLGGVGLFRPGKDGKDGEGTVERVPASKADVFNDTTLSLVEKRRLTKLLLFAAGQEPLEQDKEIVEDPDIPFVDYLKKAYSLSGPAAESLAYALALCSSPSDPALPALARIRHTIHSIGRYGPSPYLVGHYGGAGDLVGGFSRICAVWGGGQILGRPAGALEREPEVGRKVPTAQAPFVQHERKPPAPAAPEAAVGEKEGQQQTRPLGIPVELEPGEEPTMFTGDWVISSPHLLPTLFPSSSSSSSSAPTSAHLIAILPSPVAFPPPRAPADAEAGAAEEDDPDSKMFVFPPRALRDECGTVTALQVGKGTMSCPEGYHVLYLSAPLLSAPSPCPSAADLLAPYLSALLALPSASPSSSSTPVVPLYTTTYLSSPPPPPPASLPPNMLVTPYLPSRAEQYTAATTTDALDELVPLVEKTFWSVVGEAGRAEGVEFFRREERDEGEDEEQ
ncbi:hypothetical protein JCM10207_007727 [Rhodosporidiobolus poonsookiae]